MILDWSLRLARELVNRTRSSRGMENSDTDWISGVFKEFGQSWSELAVRRWCDPIHNDPQKAQFRPTESELRQFMRTMIDRINATSQAGASRRSPMETYLLLAWLKRAESSQHAKLCAAGDRGTNRDYIRLAVLVAGLRVIGGTVTTARMIEARWDVRQTDTALALQRMFATAAEQLYRSDGLDTGSGSLQMLYRHLQDWPQDKLWRVLDAVAKGLVFKSQARATWDDTEQLARTLDMMEVA